MVESVRTRQEKAIRRSRITLEAKVEEQREALLEIKLAVDDFLAYLTSAPAITPAGKTLVETFANPVLEADEAPVITPEAQPVLEDPSAVVLDPSAAA
jgi:hypothetical protein